MSEPPRKSSGEAAKGKVIITCAVTGAIHTPTMSPYLPITPDQIAAEAIVAEQVLLARKIIEGLGLEVATADDARAILELKGGDQVAF